jgi:catechol 2,3-dioxygenase-like lactoylglutathione lyase family enzyme
LFFFPQSITATIEKLAVAGVFLALATSGMQAAAQEKGHLHHVHVNVTDIPRSTTFYQQTFGVVPIQYNNRVPALLLERAFLFMNRKEPGSILNHQLTGLTHASWSTVDGANTFQWLKSRGVEFYTPMEELLPGSTYMYLYGPDREVIEIFDYQRHHRFNHIHLVAKDAKQTAQWFHALLALDKPIVSGAMRNENFDVDGVAFSAFPIGARERTMAG